MCLSKNDFIIFANILTRYFKGLCELLLPNLFMILDFPYVSVYVCVCLKHRMRLPTCPQAIILYQKHLYALPKSVCEHYVHCVQFGNIQRVCDLCVQRVSEDLLFSGFHSSIILPWCVFNTVKDVSQFGESVESWKYDSLWLIGLSSSKFSINKS